MLKTNETKNYQKATRVALGGYIGVGQIKNGYLG